MRLTKTQREFRKKMKKLKKQGLIKDQYGQVIKDESIWEKETILHTHKMKMAGLGIFIKLLIKNNQSKQVAGQARLQYRLKKSRVKCTAEPPLTYLILCA